MVWCAITATVLGGGEDRASTAEQTLGTCATSKPKTCVLPDAQNDLMGRRAQSLTRHAAAEITGRSKAMHMLLCCCIRSRFLPHSACGPESNEEKLTYKVGRKKLACHGPTMKRGVRRLAGLAIAVS